MKVILCIFAVFAISTAAAMAERPGPGTGGNGGGAGDPPGAEVGGVCRGPAC